jgi:hypothetical protein
MAAILFSVNPSNNQVSTWLNGKRFSVVAILTLLAYTYRPWGVIFYIIAPIWHMSGLPAMFICGYWWLLIAPIIFHRKLINKIGSRWEKIPPGEIKTIRPRKLVILIKMLGYHFLHCLWPRKMSFYHMFMERFGFSDEDNTYWYSFNKDFWIGLVVCAKLTLLITFNWGNPIGFGLLWWLIFILPWCQFPIGLTQAIAERNQYLPNIGLMYAVSFCCLQVPLLGDYALVAIFTYYLTKLWFYMPAYRGLEEFYRYALYEFPDHFRARAHCIQRYLQEHRIFWALYHAGIGLKHTPKDCTLNLLMCQSLMAIGAWAKAKEYLDKAMNNVVPGQDKHFEGVFNNFSAIIKDQMKNPRSVKRMKPNEVKDIPPSAIGGE